MGFFSRRRETQERLQTLERRTEELNRETQELRHENQRLRAQRSEVAARERLARDLMSRTAAKGSMSSELYNQAFPDASKYPGALSIYRSHWSSSNASLRRLSRIAAFESPTGAAMLARLSEVVIGSGLRLRAEPIWDIIADAVPEFATARDEEEKRLWRKMIERRWRLWWKGKGVSYTLEYNGYQLDQTCFQYLLKDGEYFVILRYSSARSGSPLSIQIIPPENVTGGTNPATGNTIDDGIEYDERGVAVAYHVLDDKTGITTRVPRFGARSGRVFVIHQYLKTHEKQRRGIPYLANIIHELTKLGDYEVLEIQAAIINAIFAVWVKPPADEDGQSVIGQGARRRASGGTDGQAEGNPAAEYTANLSGLDFSQGGIIADSLPAGHEIESFDTKRPNKGFDVFFTSVKRNLSAAKSQPLAAVDLAFNNSYSGARGELLMFWMSVMTWRQNHGWDFHDPIYKMWMWAEVDRGNVEAPRFDYDEFLRDAYANAQHIGNQRPDIDPKNSVEAHMMEQDRRYKTGHQITAERGGGDYDENLDVVADEMSRLNNQPQVGGLNVLDTDE